MNKKENKPIPEIAGLEDRPPEDIRQAPTLVELKEQERKDAESAHSLKISSWRNIAGLILVGILLIMTCGVAVYFKEPDYVKSFITLSSSSLMLILGYLFGTKDKQ